MTTKTSFTSGPWSRRSIPGHLFEINSSDGPVLRVRGGMMPTLEDSNLLAAAPDLLAALEQVAEQVDSPDYGGGISLETFELVKTAIRKAKGE